MRHAQRSATATNCTCFQVAERMKDVKACYDEPVVLVASRQSTQDPLEGACDLPGPNVGGAWTVPHAVAQLARIAPAIAALQHIGNGKPGHGAAQRAK